nr:polymorphic toxin-type HINT domain-containing protein [uncultured Anaerosporobacter sp.]
MTVVLVIAAIAVIVVTGGAALGPILTILVGAAKGLVAGAVIGGLIGGLSSVAAGGSFFDGFEEGAFSGAFIGALFGGIGGIGQVLGQSCKVLQHLGKIAKIVPTVSKISGGISLGMAGFDLLSLGVSLFDSKSPLVQFNKKLHSSSLYNGFQLTVSTLAIFTAGFTKGMKNPICFVAGTMILTAMGLKAIETIQPGDQVIATNPDTFQTEEKKVVETYINKTSCIVQISIQDEVICTTMNHPFYVKGQGFVSAGKLSIGDEIMNASGGSYPVECIEFEEKQETVYNFQVEDYHTYYVGEGSVLVHNDCPESGGSNGNYEKADYHGDKNNTVKNKAPNKGQEALDNSIEIGPNTTRRVGISDGEIVVFDETTSGIFHGHVRSWNELTETMKAVLRKAGMVNKKGKIIQ